MAGRTAVMTAQGATAQAVDAGTSGIGPTSAEIAKSEERQATVSALAGVSCPNASVCVAVGWSGTILTSSDGGITWADQASGTGNILWGVSCSSVRFCVAVGGSDSIVTTIDGGHSLTTRTSGTANNLLDITCTSMPTCIAMGTKGTMLIGILDGIN